MQLLCQFETEDYDAWRRDFDDDAENRMHAGLTLLQLWREADGAAGAPFALFEVNDQGKARAWLDKERGLGAHIAAHFLRTA